MTASQFFVYRRPVAWTALLATLVWGALAYLAMPQRRDPIIPVRHAVVITPYPGAAAEKVEQEVSRKIERKLAENPSVETVSSLSRPGLSVVYVELRESEKNAAAVWQDLHSKLDELTDLPRVADLPVRPQLNTDYGETVALMLTVSSPPVSDLEIELRAQAIRKVLEPARTACRPEYRANRVSGVLVYPSTVARSAMLRLGRTLLQRLTETGLIADGRILEAASTGCVDFQLRGGPEEFDRVVETWARQTQAAGQWHPDVWPGFFIRELDELEPALRRNAREKYTYRELREFADQIRDRLKRFPAVAKVEQVGQQEEQVTLGYSGQRFSQFGIRPEFIISRLQQRNTNLPGGRLDLREQNLIVRPSGEFKSEQEIGDVVVGICQPQAEAGRLAIGTGALAHDQSGDVGGYPLYLRDLVEITRGYVDPPDVLNFRTIKVPPGRGKSQTPMYRWLTERTLGISTQAAPGETVEAGDGLPVGRAASASGASGQASELQTTRAITLVVRQVKGSHIRDFARQVDAALAELEGVLPDDLRIDRTADEPAEVRHKLAEFNHCLIEAVVIVVVIAVLLMEWRSATLVAISIPVTIALTLGVCQALGIDLQQVSIGALIIALGLLVDDPVVAADAINRELAAGVRRDVAAWQGPQKLARAILYATLTNCVAFLPLLLIRGVTGEFVYSLPIVVAASLIASRFVSMTFMPLLGYYLLRGQPGLETWVAHSAAGGQTGQAPVRPPRPVPTGLGSDALFARLAAVFSRFTIWSLRRPWRVLTICAGLLAVGVALTRLIGTAFFPKDLHGVFTVNVYLPDGTPIWQTQAEAERVLRCIESLEGQFIDSYTTFVGAGGPRFWLSVVPEQRADNYAQILVHTRDQRQTGSVVARLKRALPAQIAGARLTIQQLETGPPVGLPVQVRILGPDTEQLRRLGGQVKNLLRGIPGSDDPHDDWDPEIPQVSLNVNPDRASLTGISNQDVAGLLFAGLSGYAVTQMRQEDRLIDVKLRLRNEERSGVNDLYNMYVISSLTGARVPLRQIADFKIESVPPKIRRRDHQRCLTVKCDVLPPVLPSRIVEQLRPRLETLDWPPGYRYELAGEYYEQRKGFREVSRALAACLAAIYLMLVIQFNSTIRPLIVLAAIPFGVVGGLMGLLIFKAPFGFMAFLGVASLTGVIVSHIIVLFDCIEELRQAGKPLGWALTAATLVRMRPILVTVLATVGGLVPLAVRGGPLWEPMCYVQIFGLLVATLVTLVIVPALYATMTREYKAPPGPGG